LAGATGCNAVCLSATVTAREVLRHTPAGVPALSLTLAHRSTQVEAKVPRLVQASLEAVALGALAQRMDRLRVGQAIRVTGFLANRSRRSARVVLHVNEFEIEQEEQAHGIR
jgi:primosomal replication protein N